jgi:tetratricopeptide (TPR) repeat protein
MPCAKRSFTATASFLSLSERKIGAAREKCARYAQMPWIFIAGPALYCHSHPQWISNMKNLTATICLTLTLLFGTAGLSWSADFQKGFAAAESGDYATALREWAPLAEHGHTIAQYNLGVMYEYSHGVPRDYKAAVKWYALAAEQGYASAQLNLGRMYDSGKGVPQDYKTAVKWYRLAAEQGDAFAQFNLGVMNNHGIGVPQDYKTAVKWYTLAAEQRHSDAQFNLGVMYDNGLGVPQDDKTAVKWYTLAAEEI